MQEKQRTLSTTNSHPFSLAFTVWVFTLGMTAAFFSMFHGYVHSRLSYLEIQQSKTSTQGWIDEVQSFRSQELVTYSYTVSSSEAITQTWTKKANLDSKQYQALRVNGSRPAKGSPVLVQYLPQLPQAAVLVVPRGNLGSSFWSLYLFANFVAVCFLVFGSVHITAHSFIHWRTGQIPMQLPRQPSIVITVVILSIMLGMAFFPLEYNWYALPCTDGIGGNDLDCLLTTS
ncbi:MAG: hypothetical protein MUD01_08080 [Chloroflexaceae bacterium]|jgi:hypothetical protein|nr:hypothetical protein [Chloroflexaceae bacterium]